MWPFRRKSQPDRRPDPSGKDRRLGRLGEKLARKILEHNGLKILAENYRCPAGEADLVALDPATARGTGAETIVFVEVKTRTSDRHVDPESAVNAAKRKRMKRIASYYVAAHRAQDYSLRFDIVAVVLRDGEDPQVKHIPDAF